MAGQPSSHSPYEPTNRSALQFSLTALFVLTTVFALALSAFIGISQFFGTSVSELLSMSLSRFIFAVPRLIVWTVGLAMAVRRLRSHRKPAFLTAVALGGFIVTFLLVQTVQMAVIASMRSGSSSVSISWILAAIMVFYAVVDTACWILILMAIFSGRPSDPVPLDSQSDIHDPFVDKDSTTVDGTDEGATFG